jgi:hypothetical protein
MKVTEDIRKLVDRYLDGETTNEEEALLAEYLRREDIPEEYVPLREMFEIVTKPTLPHGDSDPVRPRSLVRMNAARKMPLYVRIASIAAAAAAMFFAGYGWRGLETYHPVAPIGTQRIASNAQGSERVVRVDSIVHDTIQIVRLVPRPTLGSGEGAQLRGEESAMNDGNNGETGHRRPDGGKPSAAHSAGAAFASSTMTLLPGPDTGAPSNDNTDIVLNMISF